MNKSNKVVIGIYDSREDVETAVDTLKSSGFRSQDISVLMPRLGDSQAFAYEKETKAPEGSVIGSGTGAVIGGALGWLVGIGAIATIPALGPLVAAGPIMSALSGIAVGGAVGSLAGALIGMGIPEYEAKRYETIVKKGGILLSAHVEDAIWANRALDIFETTGAHDVSSTTEEEVPSKEKSSRDTSVNQTF